jgi:4-hydroxy-3-polyprenylbenzoate decarboxylase
MLIIPCSMGTLGRVAAGTADTLITRAADVCLKERKPLVIVPREAPLSVIHLRNLTALAEAGAVVLPACPPFYHRPESIDDLVEAVVGRALAHLGFGEVDQPRWVPPGES